MMYKPGAKRYTADSAVGGSGKNIRVFMVNWLSDGTARDLVLRNGTADDDTIWLKEPGTISKSKTLTFPGGLLFVGGCFLDFTASMVHAIISFTVES